jgi:hypothetical protein
MNGVNPEQKMNDSSSSLLDGDGNLLPTKARKQIPKPSVQGLRLLFQDVVIHLPGIGGFQAKSVLVASPVQANPGCIIDPFGLHIYHLRHLLAFRFGSAAKLIEKSSDNGTTSECAYRTTAQRPFEPPSETVMRFDPNS